MTSHFEPTNAKFEHQFASALLDGSIFIHQEHLKLTGIHISNYGVMPAISNIPEQFYRYISNLGAKGKCNKTLTVADMKTVYHFMKRSSATNFQNFNAMF